MKCRNCGFTSNKMSEMVIHSRHYGHEFLIDKKEDDDKVQFGTATSSKVPRFDYIPLSALISLANRFAEGYEIHGEEAYNGLQNQEALDNLDWVKYRLVHVIHHAYKALQDLTNGEITDNHAGAIMFGGAVLAAHLERKKNV